MIVEPTETDLGWGSPAPDSDLDSDHSPPPGLRFSAAGMQLKFSVLREGDRILFPIEGQEGDCYLKISQDGYIGLAENEAAMMAWARASGFETAETWLRDRSDFDASSDLTPNALPKALLVKRFDRSASGRIHQEDFAQIASLHPRQKYDHITFSKLGLLARAILGEEGLDEFLRRVALMVAQGNADAHLKNWSIRYLDPCRPIWSPLYDQVSTVAWTTLGGQRDDNNLALKLGGRKDFGQIDRGLLHHLAGKLQVPELLPRKIF